MSKYTIGSHGCDVRKDGEMLMAVEVTMMLEQRDDLLEALVMVRDADNDCMAMVGCLPMPSLARAKIDAVIAKAEGQQ